MENYDFLAKEKWNKNSYNAEMQNGNSCCTSNEHFQRGTE